jgi:hypothetical protein
MGKSTVRHDIRTSVRDFIKNARNVLLGHLGNATLADMAQNIVIKNTFCLPPVLVIDFGIAVYEFIKGLENALCAPYTALFCGGVYIVYDFGKVMNRQIPCFIQGNFACLADGMEPLTVLVGIAHNIGLLAGGIPCVLMLRKTIPGGEPAQFMQVT